MVQAGRHADAHCVQIMLQQFFEGGICLHAELFRDFFTGLGVHVHDADHFHICHLSIVAQMDTAHPAQTDDSDFYHYVILA